MRRDSVSAFLSDSPPATRANSPRPPADVEPFWLKSGSARSHAWFASIATLMPSAKTSLIRFTESPLERVLVMTLSSRCLVSVFMGVESQEGSERRKSLGRAAGRADGRDADEVRAGARGAAVHR